MKPALVLIAHDHLAQQIYTSAKMIVGEIEGLYPISMLADDGLEGTQAKLMKVLAEIGSDRAVLVLADVSFGTPCNVAVAAMALREDLRVVTGMNLPMVMEYAMSELTDVYELAKQIHEIGTTAVSIVDLPELSTGEEGYED